VHECLDVLLARATSSVADGEVEAMTADVTDPAEEVRDILGKVCAFLRVKTDTKTFAAVFQLVDEAAATIDWVEAQSESGGGGGSSSSSSNSSSSSCLRDAVSKAAAEMALGQMKMWTSQESPPTFLAYCDLAAGHINRIKTVSVRAAGTAVGAAGSAGSAGSACEGTAAAAGEVDCDGIIRLYRTCITSFISTEGGEPLSSKTLERLFTSLRACSLNGSGDDDDGDATNALEASTLIRELVRTRRTSAATLNLSKGGEASSSAVAAMKTFQAQAAAAISRLSELPDSATPLLHLTRVVETVQSFVEEDVLQLHTSQLLFTAQAVVKSHTLRHLEPAAISQVVCNHIGGMFEGNQQALKSHAEALYKMAGTAGLVRFRSVSRQLVGLGETLSSRLGVRLANKAFVGSVVTPAIVNAFNLHARHTRHTAWRYLCSTCKPSGIQLYAAVVAALDIAGRLGPTVYASIHSQLSAARASWIGQTSVQTALHAVILGHTKSKHVVVGMPQFQGFQQVREKRQTYIYI
jgi:hypothetical protein